MVENRITIHQAFYGEVSRAHSCIQQTLTDPDLTSFLIAFTDRPASLPPGVKLLPYLSGSAFSKYYVLTKTFSDETATRAGMVFTHVLILNIQDLVRVNDLQDVFAHFVKSTKNKIDEIKEFQVNISDTGNNPLSKHQPKYIQETISAFISGVAPILFSGDTSTFSNALQQIWNSPNTTSRKNVKFRTSFTLSDIENVKDLTIVSIQKDFLPKWQGQKIIRGDNQNKVEVTSLSEALFLGHKNGNPFYNFLVELNVNLTEAQNFGQYEKIFRNYTSINIVEDANVLRQDIRTLAKISPSPKDGKTIKGKFLDRLTALIEDKKDLNIKALRNIDLRTFENGELHFKQIVFDFVVNNLWGRTNFQVLDEILQLACNEKENNWWHGAIQDCFSVPLSKYTKERIESLWQFINFSEQACINIFSLIAPTNQNEYHLLFGIPNAIKDSIWESTLAISKKRSWNLLHSEILLKKLSIEDSIVEQLEMEENLSLDNSTGIKNLISKITSEKLIEITLKINDEKLIELSAQAVDRNVSLLKDLDLSVSCWLDIWSAFVIKTKKVFVGLIGQEKRIVFSVLDLIVQRNSVSDIVIDLLADSPFSDISDYESRSKVWEAINISQREKFLTTTTQSVFNNLLMGKIEGKSVESDISDRITSDSFMTKFLSENRNDIEPVIIVFSSFKNLKDHFLADYISYYRGTISDAQAKKLGELVSKQIFNKSARSIYDKAKYDNSFTTAYEYCKDLVTLNWWEFSKIGSPLFEERKHKPQIQSNFSKEQLVRKELPTVVILTAIQEEYIAVKKHLNEILPDKQNDTHYEVGIFEFNGKEIAKVVIRECGAKNTTSAMETERAINNFKPNAMFFVGIAGSRKPKDFSIGDVIFPETILSYEGGKSEKGSFLPRPDIGNLTYALFEIAKAERKKDDWKRLIKSTIDTSSVKADIGIIASGEQVIEHYESEVGKILTKHYNQTSAVEMEGFGFAKTINRQGRETSNMITGIVRGISDIIEQPSKSKKNEYHDRRPANAKEFASDTAAAFTFWLILKTYT